MPSKRRHIRSLRAAPENPPEGYYETVSARLGILQVILYMALLAFVVLSFLGNTNLITYRNLYLFIKDLNHSIERVDVISSDTLSYPSEEEESFALYRGGLAVAGSKTLTVFSPSGKQTLSAAISYNTPVAVGTGKYLLVYDLGGKEYTLYNSFTEIHRATTTHPITFATVSEDGSYLIVSASDQSNAIAEVYTSNFQIVNRFSSKSGYYTAAAFDEKGKRVALLSSTAGVTAFSTQLTLCEVGSNTAIFSEVISDTVALDCRFTESGTVLVLCTDRLLVRRPNGAPLSETGFSGAEVRAYALDANGIAICLSPKNPVESSYILSFDSQGRENYRRTGVGMLTGLCRNGNVIFWMEDDTVYRMDVKKGREDAQHAPTGALRILAINEKEVLLCTKKKATFLSF